MSYNPDDYRRRATAIHEAGHAVMSVHERRAFRSVSIVEDEHTLGQVVGTKVPDWFRPDIFKDQRHRNLIEREIGVFLAPLAEERFRYDAEEVPLDDSANLFELAGGAEHDRSVVAELASYVCGGEGETEAYIEWLTLRTANVIRNVGWWGAMERFADDLLTGERMGYRRARQLILTHWRESAKQAMKAARSWQGSERL